MVATSGDRLLAPDAVEALKRELLRRARVVTPNLPEAAALLATDIAADEAAMQAQAARILALGAQAVLIKGGHGEGPDSVDFLFDGAQAGMGGLEGSERGLAVKYAANRGRIGDNFGHYSSPGSSAFRPSP